MLVGAFLNFGHATPPIRMERIELNGVPVSGGLAAVDTFVGATDCDPRAPPTAAPTSSRSWWPGRSVTLEAWGKGTDDYPRRHIRSHVTLDDINEAILYNPRNCYQNYNAATNSSERMLHTYMGTLLPKLRNVSYSTAGELSPLLNDPTCRTIGMGTRIFLCGARGYVSWQGTQFNTSKPVNEHGIPIGGARTVAAIGNLREMSTDYLRAAYYEKYGVSLFVGVGIPIPLLDEELAHDVSIRNEQITTNILDFGEEERPIGRPTTPNCAAVRSRCGGARAHGSRGEPAQGARDRRNAQRLDRPRRIPPHGTRTTHARPFDGQGAESRRRITANKEKHMTTKVILYFPSDATDKAVTYDLVKRYDLRINILRAEIEAGRSGSLLVELTGEESMVREGVAYLERNGVTVSPVASKIAYDRDRCIDCGNCALACFPQALTIGAPDWRLHFDPERCIACKLCLKSCPLGLFHIEFTEA